jgi:hypothetical protein
MMAGAGSAVRATGWRATAIRFQQFGEGGPRPPSLSPTRAREALMMAGAGSAVRSVTHTRCPHARARGWAARCRSTCSGRLGGAAAAGRTMVRSPAAPSPVRFSGLLFADSVADDGARVIGATDDDDVGFAWSGRWRRRDLRGRSINDGKFSSTDMVRLASLA